MDRAVFVYTTFPGLVEAEEAAKVIVERRPAACVNMLPRTVSHYGWQGKVGRAGEVVALFKTSASLAEPVRAAIKEARLGRAGGFGDSDRERRPRLSEPADGRNETGASLAAGAG